MTNPTPPEPNTLPTTSNPPKAEPNALADSAIRRWVCLAMYFVKLSIDELKIIDTVKILWNSLTLRSSLPTRSGGLLILALLINKNSTATVWVFARLHHAYGKGYHGSGSLFPFKRRFNFKAHISPQEGR